MNAAVLHADKIPTSRLLGAYLTETRCEFMRNLRTPAIALPVLLLPVGLYLLFAVLIAGEAIVKDPPLGIFLFSAFAVMAVTMPALFNVGASLAMERENGMLRLKRAQPAPAGSWLVAKIASGLAFGVLAYTPMVVAAIVTGKLPLDGAQLAGMSVALLLGALPFCALGLMIATFVSGSAAPGYANLVYLPGCYLSGMFFPLPASMHWQTPFWPQFHVNQLAMHAAGVEKFQFEPVAVAAGALLGFTVLFGVVATWRLAHKG